MTGLAVCCSRICPRCPARTWHINKDKAVWRGRGRTWHPSAPAAPPFCTPPPGMGSPEVNLGAPSEGLVIWSFDEKGELHCFPFHLPALRDEGASPSPTSLLTLLRPERLLGYTKTNEALICGRNTWETHRGRGLRDRSSLLT